MLFRRPKQQVATPQVDCIPEEDLEGEIESRVTARIGAVMYEREALINDLHAQVDGLRGQLEAARSEIHELRIDLDIERRMGHVDAVHRKDLNNALSTYISLVNMQGVQIPQNASARPAAQEPPAKLGERTHQKRAGYTTTPTARQADYLYLMRCGPYVKIGVSTQPDKRLREVGVGAPDQVTLLGAWRHDQAWRIEETLHRKFAAARTQGEWFVLNDDTVRSLMHQLDTNQLG